MGPDLRELRVPAGEFDIRVTVLSVIVMDAPPAALGQQPGVRDTIEGRRHRPCRVSEGARSHRSPAIPRNATDLGRGHQEHGLAGRAWWVRSVHTADAE